MSVTFGAHKKEVVVMDEPEVSSEDTMPEQSFGVKNSTFEGRFRTAPLGLSHGSLRAIAFSAVFCCG